RLAPVRDQALRLDPAALKSDVGAPLSILHEVRRRRNAFELPHFHIALLHIPIFQDVAGRTLTPLHGRLDLKDLPGAYRCWPQYTLASISDNQRKPLWFAPWTHTA